MVLSLVPVLFVLQWTVVDTRPSSGAPIRPLNVIVIVTDDQTFSEMQYMPQTQAWFDQHGVTYSDSSVSLSWCCPARVTLQTGQHAHNHGVFSNAAPAGGAGRFDDSTALATWLDPTYRTIHIGKAPNGTRRNLPDGWDRWQSTLAGDHKMYNWRTIDEVGEVSSYGTGPENYQGDVYTAMAVAEISDAANGAEPFYLQFMMSAPHHGRGGFPEPHPEFKNTVNDLLPRPPNYELPAGLDYATAAHRYQRRAESLLGADAHQVMPIIRAVEQAGIQDETIIIFTSDNGFQVATHGMWGKSVFWEESMRVPMMAAGPGFAAGTVETAPVQNVDIAATVAAAARVTPSIAVDGIDLRGVLPSDRAMVFESKRDHPAIPLWEGIRTPRFRFVDQSAGQADRLYDMAIDPFQLTNRLDDPDYATVVSSLRAILALRRDCAGSDCLFTVDDDALFEGTPPSTTTTTPSTTTTASSTTTTTQLSTTTASSTTTTTQLSTTTDPSTTTSSSPSSSTTSSASTTIPPIGGYRAEASWSHPGVVVELDVNGDATATVLPPLQPGWTRWQVKTRSVAGGKWTSQSGPELVFGFPSPAEPGQWQVRAYRPGAGWGGWVAADPMP